MELTRIIYADTPRGTKKYLVRLTEAERTELERLTTTGRTAAGTLRHAWVLRKADVGAAGPGWTDTQIKDVFGVRINTIGRIRQAFVAEGREAALHGRPRPAPPPRKMDGEQEAHLVALRCGPTPKGDARWTLRRLTDRFAPREGRVEVSRETVRRTRKTTCAHAVAEDGIVHAA